MLLPSPTDQDIPDDGKQLRTITSIYPITEEVNQDDVHQTKYVLDDPLTTLADVGTAGQQPETVEPCPTESAGPSSPAKSSSATSPHEPPTTLPLGLPPPSSRHYFLKEMWPGQPICHLCHGEYKKTNRAIRALPCGDIFHRACIDHLLGQKESRCPSCEASIPAEWYIPHRYDPTMPAGSPCLYHAGVTAETNRSPCARFRAIHALCKRTKESIVRCVPARRTKRLYASWKTESGQTRYVERETGGALPAPRFEHADGDGDDGGGCG